MDNPLVKRAPAYIIGFFVGIELILLWSLHYLPFMDHPSHLFRQFVLLNLHNPLFNFSEYYKVNLLTPNIIGDLIVLLFARLGAPLEIASKLFYSLYIVLLPGSAWYFLKKTSTGNVLYVLFSILITFNLCLLLGNENFLISLPIFLIGMGYRFSHLDDSSLRCILVHVLVAAVLVLTHGFTYLCFVLCVIVSLFFSSLAWPKRLLPVMAAMVPISFNWFAVQNVSPFFVGRHISLSRKLMNMGASLVPRINDVSWDKAILVCLFALMVLLAVAGIRRGLDAKRRALLLSCTLFFLLWVLLPKWWMIHLPQVRIGILMFLMLPGLFPKGGRLPYLFAAVLVPVIFLYQFHLNQEFQRGSRQIQNLTAFFETLPEGKTVFPVTLDRSPALHRAFEYYHIRKGGMGPYHFIGDIYLLTRKTPAPGDPPLMDFERNEESLRILSDYDLVFLIGDEESSIFKANFVRLFHHLKFGPVAGYRKGVIILAKEDHETNVPLDPKGSSR